MWVCTNFGFFSAVERKGKDLPLGDNRTIQIRARDEGQLKMLRANYFKDELSEVIKLKGRDYQVRAYCTPEALGRALTKIAMDIDYTNFKDSVEDHDLHTAYMKVWSAMAAVYGTGYETGNWWETYRTHGASKYGTSTTGYAATPGKRGNTRGNGSTSFLNPQGTGWATGPDAFSQPALGDVPFAWEADLPDDDELEVVEGGDEDPTCMSLSTAARLVGVSSRKLRDFMLTKEEWKDYRDGFAWFIPSDMIEDLEFKFWAEVGK